MNLWQVLWETSSLPPSLVQILWSSFLLFLWLPKVRLHASRFPHILFARILKKICAYNKGHFTHEPRATSRDHEIVITQKKVSKGCPKTSPKSCSVCHGSSSVVWSHMWLGASTKCYFNEFLFMQVLTHDKIESINGCECLECHDLPVFCVRPTSNMWFSGNSPSDHAT